MARAEFSGMIAAEGVIRLGTAGLESHHSAWLDHMRTGGCLAVTRPHTADVAAATRAIADSSGASSNGSTLPQSSHTR